MNPHRKPKPKPMEKKIKLGKKWTRCETIKAKKPTKLDNHPRFQMKRLRRKLQGGK